MCGTSDGMIRTTAQLRSEGRSRRAIARETSGLIVVRRGVYASPDACAAAVDAAAHGGSLACITAARHLGLWVLDEGSVAHVWMRRGGHRHHRDEQDPCKCVEHWDDDRGPDSFALPPVPRILRQILFCRGIEEFFVVLESALRLKLIDAEGLTWLGAHTSAAARAAIAFARTDADSGLESLIRGRLRAYGLPVRTQVVIPATGRVDLLIGDRLVVEADGAANHADAEHRHKDLRRDANAAIWGYLTLRFDYALIVHDWDLVERAIMAHVAAGRHL